MRWQRSWSAPQQIPEAFSLILDAKALQGPQTGFRQAVVVIPKREVDYLFDLEPGEYTAFWEAVRTVEARLRERLGFARTVVVAIGWEVPHVHVHLIPTDGISDVPMPPHVEMSQEELAALAEKIRD